MKRFLRKALLWLAGIFATLIVLLILFYAEEDWRGARDWAACQKELQAKGETLDLRQLAPPGKPEDDLSKVPIFAELYEESDASERGKTYSRHRPRISYVDVMGPDVSGAPPYISRWKTVPIDLVAWQRYYEMLNNAATPASPSTPAENVLTQLKNYDRELSEIDQAVSRLGAFWPLLKQGKPSMYAGGGVALSHVGNVVVLKGIAELAEGHIDSATQDFLFLDRMASPTLMVCDSTDFAIRADLYNGAEAILWEGIHHHQWSAIQLERMESAFASTDMLTLATKMLRTDRAFGLASIQILRTLNRETAARRFEGSDSASLDVLYSTWYIRPSGWWNQDLKAYSLLLQKRIEAINPSSETLNSRSFANAVRDTTPTWESVYIPCTTSCSCFSDAVGTLIAKAETYRRLARLACRLEEYRIAHAQYPDKLDELPDLPAHLNQEVLSEQPLRYQRKGDGYLLYSIGWNQKDDGGLRATDDKEGDWGWPSP